MTEFDYVIVGAGSSGCVLANRLSADGRHSVLLLEAGPRDNYLWIHIPIGYGKTMFHKAYNWGFHTEPEAEMHGREIYWPRGRGLGGSSSINGLIFIRGQRADYDHWAQLGNAGWDWNSVLPYFVKSEHNSRGPSATHGGNGPQVEIDKVKKEWEDKGKHCKSKSRCDRAWKYGHSPWLRSGMRERFIRNGISEGSIA